MPNGGFGREPDEAAQQSSYGPYGPQDYPQPEYPPPYGQPPYPPPMPWAVPRPTNGMAVASLVLGILWLYWVGSVLALIFGYIARRQIRERGEGGDGMAIAGIVLGWVGVGIAAVFVVIMVVAATSSGAY